MKKRILLILALFILSGCTRSVSALQKPEFSEPQSFEYEYTENDYYTEDISYDILGEFTTEFNKNNKSRSHNLALAANAINGTIVEPGEVFSFNKTVGSTSKANGYKLAKVFVSGQESKGYGGGVCQVSSTLYNAVEQAGLEVVEIHHHSRSVGYVENGQDATTSNRGKLDFKFENTLDVPIVINSEIFDNTVTVSIQYA